MYGLDRLSHTCRKMPFQRLILIQLREIQKPVLRVPHKVSQDKQSSQELEGSRGDLFAGLSWRIPLISKVATHLSCNFQSEFTELSGPNQQVLKNICG